MMRDELDVIIIESDVVELKDESVITIDDDSRCEEGSERNFLSSSVIETNVRTIQFRQPKIDIASSPTSFRKDKTVDLNIIDTPVTPAITHTPSSGLFATSSSNIFGFSSSPKDEGGFIKPNSYTVDISSSPPRRHSINTVNNDSDGGNLFLSETDVDEFNKKLATPMVNKSSNVKAGYTKSLPVTNSTKRLRADPDITKSSIFNSDGFDNFTTTFGSKSRRLSVSQSSSPAPVMKNNPRYEFKGDFSIDTDSDDFLKLIDSPELMKKRVSVASTIAKPTPTFKMNKIQTHDEPKDKLKDITTNNNITTVNSNGKHSTTSVERAKRQRDLKAALKFAEEIEKKKKKQIDLVNKKVTSRSACINEIIIDLSSNLFNSEFGKQIKQQMLEKEVHVESSDIEVNNKDDESNVEQFSLITFRRKATSKYDADNDIYIPIPTDIIKEPIAIVYINGENLADILSSEEKKCNHLDEIEKLLPNYQILYLIEGLHIYLKKVELELDKKLTQRTRQLLSGTTEPAIPVPITPVRLGKQIRDTLIEFEINHGFKIVNSKSSSESLKLLLGFTMDIASKHYKSRELLGKETIETTGNIKSGSTIPETLAFSLAQIKYLTPNTANMVTSIYKNMYELMESIDIRGTEALEGLKKSSGKRSTKVVNSSLSKSVCMILTSKNAEQLLQS